MPRTILVDGYNALYKLFDAPPGDRDASRGVLVRRARQALEAGTLRSGRDARVHLIFDTRRGSTRTGATGKDGCVSWQYADGSADDAIVEWLRRHEAHAEDVVVVTDDRELRGRAKQMGAKALRVHDFFDASVEERTAPAPLRPPSGPRPPPLKPSDFGLGEGAIDLDAVDPDDL